MPPKAELLEREGRNRQEHAEQQRHQQERRQKVNRDRTGRVGNGDDREAEQLKHRPEQLEDEEIRHGRDSEEPIPRVPPQSPMPPQGLGESTLPPAALPRELTELLRTFGPADRVGHELDAVLLAATAEI